MRVLEEFMKYDPLFDMSLFRIFMVLGEFMKCDPLFDMSLFRISMRIHS